MEILSSTIHNMQPSSVAAECISSILSNSFSSKQESSLEDYIELSIMYRTIMPINGYEIIVYHISYGIMGIG